MLLVLVALQLATEKFREIAMMDLDFVLLAFRLTVPALLLRLKTAQACASWTFVQIGSSRLQSDRTAQIIGSSSGDLVRSEGAI